MIQENQYVKIKVEENPFIGPIKRVAQTFFRNPHCFAMYNGVWQPIKFETVQETRPMMHIATVHGRDLYVTEDQILLTPGEKCKFAKDLQLADRICLEKSMTEHSTDEIKSVMSVTQRGEWLFAIKVSNLAAPYFAFENGIIARGEL